MAVFRPHPDGGADVCNWGSGLGLGESGAIRPGWWSARQHVHARFGRNSIIQVVGILPGST